MLKDLFDNHKYVICAGLSTFSILLTAISIISISKSVNEVSNALKPISEWADSQNECITKTWRIDGKNTRGIPSKVWSCNGGGD
tara:strand:- start:5126 stop:5377 length:252 start_codon:yes stop_codon:yes gene_type:complete